MSTVSAVTSPPPPPPPPLDEALIRQVSPGAGVVERWIERARSNLMKVRRCPGDAASVQQAIAGCLAPHRISRCLLNAPQWEARLGLPGHLEGLGMQVVRWGGADCSAAAFSCEAAVTECRAGLADAGTIVVWSDAAFGRSSTLVTAVHVILLAARQILPDLADGLKLIEDASLQAGHFPSNIVLINGPSKTADIEMNMITGVHGAKDIYVVVVDEAEGQK
jgi:L-lactate dehydrogenase complex protein LldG